MGGLDFEDIHHLAPPEGSADSVSSTYESDLSPETTIVKEFNLHGLRFRQFRMRKLLAVVS